MTLKLIYLMFTKLLGLVLLHIRSDTTKDIEILVYAINSRCCNGALHARRCPGPTGHSPPPSPGCYPPLADAS